MGDPAGERCERMKAAVCDVFGKPLTIREVPTPSPGPGELRIRVHGCGVCHSDLHLVDGDWAAWGTPLPIIPGHEVTGIVDTVGEGVTAFAPGDRAGVPWMQYACGRCAPCKAGAEMLCAAQRSTGVTVNGGYAEYVSAPEAFVHRIPEGLDLVEAAPLLCAGITVFAPLRRAGNLAGKTVAVAGIGGLGHLGVRMAAAMGAHVVAIVRGPGKAELACSLGAHVRHRLGEGEDRPGVDEDGRRRRHPPHRDLRPALRAVHPGAGAERDAGDPRGDRGERLGPPGGDHLRGRSGSSGR